jgi:pimeloyl-ACP methyl ester carboxylesterase
MSPRLRTIGVVGGLAGVVVAGVAAGAAAGLLGRQRWRPPPGEPFGELPAERGSAVVADDGVTLWVEQTPGKTAAPLTVVFCHGFALDQRMWYFQRRDLPKLVGDDLSVVCYDHRSHGRSSHSSRRSSTIEQLSRDLGAVLDATVPDGPIVLAGHSMGAMTIMALAEYRPELFARRVVGVALLCTSAGDLGNLSLARLFLSERSKLTAFGAIAAARRPDIVEWGRRLTAPVVKPLIRRFAFGSGPVDPEVVDLVERMIAATSVEVLTDFARTLGEHDRYRALAGLRHCHVLVMGGDADRLTPYSHTEALAAQLPDAELVRIPGAGHLAMLEQPEFVNEHLAELLRRSLDMDKGRRG